MFSLKPDFDSTRSRMDAFWAHDVLDRPMVSMDMLKPAAERRALPQSHHPDPAARWLDAAYQAEWALTDLGNHVFLGDTLPVACPNLGAEVFSALYGCPIHYGEGSSSWTEPILEDWSQAGRLRINWDSPVLNKMLEITDALLAAGQGKFITGMPDWHPGGDAIAAFRGPQRLVMDLMEHPDEVKALLTRLEGDYYKLYDLFYKKMRAARQPVTTRTHLFSDERFQILSNDFAMMASKELFDAFFLEGITRECQYLDHSIYQLDGPGALRHLDSILSVHELDALVCGAGNEGIDEWMRVYQKAQAAGKGIQVHCELNEIKQISETLSPRGLYLCVKSVPDRDTGLALLKTLEDWTADYVGKVY